MPQIRPQPRNHRRSLGRYRCRDRCTDLRNRLQPRNRPGCPPESRLREGPEGCRVAGETEGIDSPPSPDRIDDLAYDEDDVRWWAAQFLP